MLKNHLFVAIRNFKKRKAFTLINVLGLTVGMTVCLLILSYARYEMSYDKYHSKADNIYRVSVDIFNGEDFQMSDAQCYPGAGLLGKEEFPEIIDYAMARGYGRFLFKNGDISFNESDFYFVNQAWLTVFDWQMAKGDRETALDKPDQLVISESTAKKFFGDEDPIGKILTVVPGGAEVPMMVTGVFKDVPENSHMHFNILISYESAVKYLGSKYDEFNGNNEYVFLLANQPLDNDFKKRYNATYFERTEAFIERGDSLTIQALTDIHLKSDRTFEAEANGNYRMVNILLLVALFVLVIAWVNYINLATARALDRAKEVGVRKVLGSTKTALIRQFMLESFMLNFIALILTVTLIQGILPAFNNLAGVNLSFNILQDNSLLMQLLGIFLIGSLASGLYPSLILSNYKPLVVITGKLKDSRKGVFLRKGLVVFQFLITMVLLVGTMTIYQQVNHMRKQDLGVDLDRTVVINMPIVTDSDSLQSIKLKSLSAELERNSQINAVTFTETVPGQGSLDMNTTTGFYNAETEEGRNINFYFFRVDDSYIETFGIDILAGRAMKDELETPFEDNPGMYNTLIINETARRALGFQTNEEAVGARVSRWGRIFNVTGVMEDYHHLSLKDIVHPMALFYDRTGNHSTYINVKLNGNATNQNGYRAALSDIEETYRDIFPNSEFDFFFLDENFNKQYRADQQFGTVFTLFAGITIFVALLGLFGLVLFEVQQRIKEIGIRKVLGASAVGIIKMLSLSFMKLVLISIVIALPIAYFGMESWLNGYAYRIDIGVWLFLVPGIALLAVALLTIAMQSAKAANQNPVKALRYE